MLQHISYFEISLTTGFVKINDFFLVYQFKAFNAVIVEENVVIVCFLNAMRKKIELG